MKTVSEHELPWQVHAYIWCPEPQALSIPTSDGPVQDIMLPVAETHDSERRLMSTRWPILLLPSSLSAGMENARALPSPKSPTRLWPRPSVFTTAAESHK